MSCPYLPVRILTHYPETADMNLIKRDYIPPFDEVQNFPQKVKRIYARQIRMHKTLIDQSDFLIIWKGSNSTLLKRLEKYIQRRKGLKVLEMKSGFLFEESD